MLAEDNCHPFGSDDVTIAFGYINSNAIPRNVQMIAFVPPGTKSCQPTYERWAMFGWEVDRKSLQVLSE